MCEFIFSQLVDFVVGYTVVQNAGTVYFMYMYFWIIGSFAWNVFVLQTKSNLILWGNQEFSLNFSKKKLNQSLPV